MSLWELMNHFDLHSLTKWWANLSTLEGVCRAGQKEHGGSPAARDSLDQIRAELRKFAEFFAQHDMPSCGDSVDAALFQLAQPNIDVSSVVTAIHSFRLAIVQQFKKTLFLRISEERAAYLDREDLFGEQVKAKVPSAVPDIRDAGNCLALDLNTAAVFHLMRVAEHGLRHLAKALKVRLTHSGKHHPIEYADWNKIIEGVQNKIRATRTLNPGPKKEALLVIYSDAADHCTYMRDLRRNNISHARKPYIYPEALSAYERVRAFMQFLATGLKSRS
ncbi:MAG TPA: hypothetical protein VHU83_22055 [Bryobacteraceae bacterium]|nr:hypothetical protein [Bryobacteraceae bacterium]